MLLALRKRQFCMSFWIVKIKSCCFNSESHDNQENFIGGELANFLFFANKHETIEKQKVKGIFFCTHTTRNYK